MTEPSWEPPVAGSEAEHLTGTLERLRATFRWKTDGLDAAGLSHRIPSSELTLGGLLKHLALVEDDYFFRRLSGEDYPPVWGEIGAARGDFQWFFDSAAEDSPEKLYGLWDDAANRSRRRLAAALEHGGLDQPVDMGPGDGSHANLRRLLMDMIEEYGRHTGHADLLREAVDGRVGEDPPREFTFN